MMEAPKLSLDRVGSISHGTLREDHLISVYARELRELWPERADVISGEYADVIEDAFASENTAVMQMEPSDRSGYCLEALADALDELSPPGHYFGSHPGDGADIGWWLGEEDDVEEEPDYLVPHPIEIEGRRDYA